MTDVKNRIFIIAVFYEARESSHVCRGAVSLILVAVYINSLALASMRK